MSSLSSAALLLTGAVPEYQSGADEASAGALELAASMQVVLVVTNLEVKGGVFPSQRPCELVRTAASPRRS